MLLFLFFLLFVSFYSQAAMNGLLTAVLHFIFRSRISRLHIKITKFQLSTFSFRSNYFSTIFSSWWFPTVFTLLLTSFLEIAFGLLFCFSVYIHARTSKHSFIHTNTQVPICELHGTRFLRTDTHALAFFSSLTESMKIECECECHCYV